jgi:cephalosporin-C deacetylase
MKRNQIILFTIIAFVFLPVIGNGQIISLKQTNESGIYRSGEKISVIAYTDIKTSDSVRIRVLKNNTQTIKRTAIIMDKDSLLLFEGSFGDPCSVIIEARYKGGNTSLGLLVEPGKIKPGTDCPKDFDDYWKLQKKNLNALPLQVLSIPVKDASIETGYSCVDIEINCTGPKPARGYFAKPEKAAHKSLPAVLLVHAAGVKGSWCLSEPENAMKYAKMGTLCFDLNAHGMLNGQPESYYADLEQGELRNYFMQGLTSREDFYFRGMYLRLLRTIDFLTRQPEWDGKRILVIGESQGGGQALVAAGLDKRVSAVVAIVPAMCDWLGPLADRRGGWPQPLQTKASNEEMLKVLPYFDASNILKGSKATIFTEIGLIDMTCPSTSVFAAINQSKGEKIIYAVPYRPHQSPQKTMTKLWEETVLKSRESFIRDYLK